MSTGVNNNNNQENLTQRRGQNNEEATPTPTTTVETPVRPPTFLDACKRGAFTFFASLWPTYGQDARIAQAFENEEEREGVRSYVKNCEYNRLMLIVLVGRVLDGDIENHIVHIFFFSLLLCLDNRSRI